MRIKWFSLVRIIGLVLVLFYHFFVKQFPGGFIGVDIFFVFSGYLITSLFFIELEKSQTFDVLKYYKRRFLRIFPPLVMMIMVVLPFSLLLPSDFRANLAKQVSAAIGFATNRFEILSGSSYEAQQTPKLFVHTWTLSLEFIFYLIWGVILLGIVLLLKHFKQKDKFLIGYTKILVLIVSLFLAVFSIIRLQLTFDPHYLSYSYFSFSTHMFPFFIGAITAVFFGIKIEPEKKVFFASYPLKKWVLGTILASGVLLFLTIFGKFESTWTIRTNLILSSLMAALLIVQFRILHERTTIDEPKGLTVLADTSYSVYLFHWPVWLIISHFISQVFIAGILSFFISLLFACLVYYGVEPYFHGKALPTFMKEKLFYAGVGALSLIGLVIAISAPKLSKIEQSINEAQISQTMTKLDKQGQLAQNLVDTGKGIFANTAWQNASLGFLSSADLQLKQTVLKDVETTSDDVLNATQTILGDSVMVGVVPYLTTILPDADVSAEVGRNYDNIYKLFAQKVKEKTIGSYIVISAGANVTADMITDVQKIISESPKGSRIVFVTPFDGNNMGVLNQFNAQLREMTKQHPWVVIVDWAAYISPLQNELWADKIHFGGKPDVSSQYLDLVVKGLNQVSKVKGKP